VPAHKTTAGSFCSAVRCFGAYKCPAIRVPSLKIHTTRRSTFSGNAGIRGAAAGFSCARDMLADQQTQSPRAAGTKKESVFIPSSRSANPNHFKPFHIKKP
jgi:hypothetical protein